jgi:LmbE family N-acetylglucosaminyl deacetylase
MTTAAGPPGPPVLLPTLPDESFERVLCVVAHPDDVEYGTAAAVARWTAAGVDVAYLLLTQGEAGMDTLEPDRTAQLRMREQLAAADAVGVRRVDFLRYPDGVLEYGLDLRRDVARTIRGFRPDVVVIGSWDIIVPIGLNQADHRVASLVAADAVRDADNRWVFPDLLAEGLEPWSVRWLLQAGVQQATHAVDVTGEPFERGVAALEAHREYLTTIPGHPSPRDLLTQMHRRLGGMAGVPAAVTFRAWDLLTPPPMPVPADVG